MVTTPSTVNTYQRTTQKVSQMNQKINRLTCLRSIKFSRISLGLSLPEVLITTSIIGTVGSIAFPKYIDQINQGSNQEVKAIVATVPSIVSAYIDATGELPTEWDDLSSIAAVMTNNGPATGQLSSPIILQKSNYELSIEGPTNSIYSLTATPQTLRNTDEPGEANENRFGIYSCFNVSNGASDLKSGNGIEIKATLNCG